MKKDFFGHVIVYLNKNNSKMESLKISIF